MRRMELGSGPHYQRGISIVLVTVSMLALLAVTGLALDMGDVFDNKTRLQNALDASALSGAQELVLKPGDTDAATAAARDTFNKNKDEGNEALASIADTDVHTEFSKTLVPWSPGSGATFIRVWVDNFNLKAYLISVLGIDQKTVVASATAGPAPAQCPNFFPLLACGDASQPPSDDGTSGWGYTHGQEVVLKYNANGCPEPDSCDGPGNFQVLDVGSGARAVRDAICGLGTNQCVGAGTGLPTEPGNIVGPVGNAINCMFGDCGGGLTNADDSCPNLDTNTDQYGGEFGGTEPYYDNEYSKKENNQKRIVTIPIGVCTEDGGKKVVQKLGEACFLITREAEISGNTQLVYGEFLDTGNGDTCLVQSGLAPITTSSPGGPTIVILYKDQILNDG